MRGSYPWAKLSKYENLPLYKRFFFVTMDRYLTSRGKEVFLKKFANFFATAIMQYKTGILLEF